MTRPRHRAGLALAALLCCGAAHLDAHGGSSWPPHPKATPAYFARVNAAGDAAKHCGVPSLGDFSAKFTNLRPGYYIAAAGSFSTRTEADQVLARVHPCLAAAYLRQTATAGE